MFAPRKVKTHNCEKRESALTCIRNLCACQADKQYIISEKKIG